MRSYLTRFFHFLLQNPPDPRRVSEAVSEAVSEGVSEGFLKGFKRVLEGVSPSKTLLKPFENPSRTLQRPLLKPFWGPGGSVAGNESLEVTPHKVLLAWLPLQSLAMKKSTSNITW